MSHSENSVSWISTLYLANRMWSDHDHKSFQGVFVNTRLNEKNLLHFQRKITGYQSSTDNNFMFCNEVIYLPKEIGLKEYSSTEQYIFTDSSNPSLKFALRMKEGNTIILVLKNLNSNYNINDGYVEIWKWLIFFFINKMAG